VGEAGGDSNGISPEVPPPASRFSALEHRDFRLYWAGQFVSTAGTQMQLAAVAWQVYLLSHSALALGMLGLVRIGPIIVFSLGGGVFADALDRRRLMLVTQSLLLSVSVALAVTTATHSIALWMVYLLAGGAAAANAFDSPARQALVPSLVPSQKLANAISLNTTMFQVATVLGPSIAGLVIATRGLPSVYEIDAISFLVVLAVLLVIRPRALAGRAPRISWHSALEGLAFVRRSPILLWTTLLDFVATFFGSATALLPIFARDILHVGSQGYGLLYAAPSLGAVVAGIILSTRARSIHRQGLIILASVAAYGAFTIAFGSSRVFLISLLALAGVGASDTVSMILRQTIRQMVTPDELRGRMTSVSMVFFMGGPQLGEAEAGLVARGFGAPASVISGGVAAIAAVALIAYGASKLRNYQAEARAA
jgi:MFS family permease